MHVFREMTNRVFGFEVSLGEFLRHLLSRLWRVSWQHLCTDPCKFISVIQLNQLLKYINSTNKPLIKTTSVLIIFLRLPAIIRLRL